ncbi:MAG: type IV toxin-antitoxin system AbiEi family antitoxin domain-containing protein [Chloroflexi bacterium]|nr:type IV toxin-antitoxin system AbiEi family antitoxin domain-containing protein [Chloroflexota bacterium]
MSDIIPTNPDHRCLFEVASTQLGYFTAAQARRCGFGWDLLSHHARTGRFVRVRRGLYRLRDYPSSPHEEVMAAWLALGPGLAVISHESALDLLGLSDLIPDTIHLTVSRSKRHLPALPGVTIHTTTRPLAPTDVVTSDGLRVTAAARSILDAAATGVAPEQIELAVAQALGRSLTTPAQLEAAAQRYGGRVRRLVAGALRAVA